MRRLLVVTRNRFKLREIKELLSDIPWEIKVLEAVIDPGNLNNLMAEDGDSYEANARNKALFGANLGFVSLGEDSGLEVACLAGKPGIFSARFAGEGATPQENIKKLLKLLEKTPGELRTARFVCVCALALSQNEIRISRGECEGRIAFEPKGTSGFGYDPIFIPKGFSQTFAELGSEVKNKISHRAKALSVIRDWLIDLSIEP